MHQQVQDWHKKFKSSGGTANLLQHDEYDPVDLPSGLTIYALESLDYGDVLETLGPRYDQYDPAQVYNLDTPPRAPPAAASYTLLTRDREARLLEELAQLRRLRSTHDARVDDALSENDPEQFAVGTRRNPRPQDDEEPEPVTTGRTRSATRLAKEAVAPEVPDRPPTPATYRPRAPESARVLGDPKADIHPFRNGANAPYDAPRNQEVPARAPPVEQPAQALPKERDGPRVPAYRHQAPVATDDVVDRVFDALLDAEVRVRQRDLLAVAPGIRDKLKGAVSARRVPPPGQAHVQPAKATVNFADKEEIVPPRAFAIADPSDPSAEAYFNDLVQLLYEPIEDDENTQPANDASAFNVDVFEVTSSARAPEPPSGPKASPFPPGMYKVDDPSDVLRSAPKLGAIRSLRAVVNHTIVAYPILDPGAQIVAMSEAVATHAGIAWDPDDRIILQSANGGVNESLGLAKNVPFTFGDLTVYLQCHITQAPAYDVLLGRPFNILCETLVQDLPGEHQTVTIHDPNERARRQVMSSVPRKRIQFRLPGGVESDFPMNEEEPALSGAAFQRRLRWLKSS